MTAGRGRSPARSGSGSPPTPTAPARPTCPAPRDAAPPLPAGLEHKVRGISPLRTANGHVLPRRHQPDRARASTSTAGPSRSTAMVERPSRSPTTSSRRCRMIERDITMTCVSNEVGGGYVGAARWLGRAASATCSTAPASGRGADQMLSTAVDGFTISTPLQALRDGRDAMHRRRHERRAAAGRRTASRRASSRPASTASSAPRSGSTRLTATTYAAEQAYWTERGWATDAPIKTQSAHRHPARPVDHQGRQDRHRRRRLGAAPRRRRRSRSAIDDGAWQHDELGPGGRHRLLAPVVPALGRPSRRRRYTPRRASHRPQGTPQIDASGRRPSPAAPAACRRSSCSWNDPGRRRSHAKTVLAQTNPRHAPAPNH